MQKSESCGGSGTFVAIDEGLAFSKVIGVSGGYTEQIGIGIVIDILPLGNRRFD